MRHTLYFLFALLCSTFISNEAKGTLLPAETQSHAFSISNQVQPPNTCRGMVVLVYEAEEHETYVCLRAESGLTFMVANGNGMLTSGRVVLGEMVTARVVREPIPGDGMGTVVIIFD